MEQAFYILKKYWRYSKFRPLQEEVIASVLEGNDTLALMPTGGGKSLCFQVPGMVKDGVCIVVSPLIALMKDQVQNLQKREIKAIAIYSGMTKKEIDVALDNCIYGNYKFLYVSPERLKTDIFKERLKKMQVSLLAVDEAHCISQWGYDFRPDYLDIADMKSLFKDPVPVIALTATATPEVKEDILEKLQIEDAQVFTKSFVRDNLAYVARKTDNKDQQVKRILQNVPGTSVLYVSTRKSTYEWADKLNRWGIKAEYYHGGMTTIERSARQEAWMHNKARAIVSTNAFGMGIDKPDVRTVIHLSLPSSIEAYFQEAGRAGRDEKKAYATLLFDEHDEKEIIEKIEISYPSADTMKKVYQCLANYYKLAVGSGDNHPFPFEIKDFVKTYNLDLVSTFHSLKRLEEQGLLKLNEAFFQPSKLMFIVDKQGLYEFQVANATLDVLIKAILRLYGGETFNNFIKINESQIAQLISYEMHKVKQQLEYLDKQNIIIYEQQKDRPELIFLTPRQDVGKLNLDMNHLKKRKKIELEKAKALIAYIYNDKRCRTLQLLDYFGEVSNSPCGVCDVCLKKKQEQPSADLIKSIKAELQSSPLTIEALLEKIKPKDQERFVLLVRQLLDQEIISYNSNFELKLN